MKAFFAVLKSTKPVNIAFVKPLVNAVIYFGKTAAIITPLTDLGIKNGTCKENFVITQIASAKDNGVVSRSYIDEDI